MSFTPSPPTFVEPLTTKSALIDRQSAKLNCPSSNPDVLRILDIRVRIDNSEVAGKLEVAAQRADERVADAMVVVAAEFFSPDTAMVESCQPGPAIVIVIGPAPCAAARPGRERENDRACERA